MDILTKLILITLLVSCAKLSYMSEQAIGQLSLEVADVDVEDFVKDTKQKETHRKKVEVVVKAKEYFYKFFNFEPVPIYDEVKILDQEAVTYLVIYSPKDRIKAMETWFPILGSFPYLGFFSKNSAINFVNEKKEEGFHTYMRPVYAYSTLNHPLMPFDDNILSSFFNYSDTELVELIFHELTHTIVFVKDNVSFNENLANFISEELLYEYLNLNENQRSLRLQKQRTNKILFKTIYEKSLELKELYKQNSSRPDVILKSFLENSFNDQIEKLCEELKVKFCWPLKGKWNNARFAAIGTYSDKAGEIQKIYKKSGLSLKDFVKKIIALDNQYDGEGKNFLQFLQNRIR